MDAELKQAFDSLSDKIDDLKKSIEKIETAHNLDHDKLIRLEGSIEENCRNFTSHCEAEARYGIKVDARIESIEEKLVKYGVIITIIASSLGGGAGELVRFFLGGQ